MKQSLILISLLLTTLVFGQNQYDSLWKEVQKLEGEGLTQSALKEVTKIESLARKEKNTPQQIKTLLYKSKYALILEEDAQLSIVSNFKEQIKTASFPEKNILQKILGRV